MKIKLWIAAVFLVFGFIFLIWQFGLIKRTRDVAIIAHRSLGDEQLFHNIRHFFNYPALYVVGRWRGSILSV